MDVGQGSFPDLLPQLQHAHSSLAVGFTILLFFSIFLLARRCLAVLLFPAQRGLLFTRQLCRRSVLPSISRMFGLSFCCNAPPVEPVDDKNILGDVLKDHEDRVGQGKTVLQVPGVGGHQGHNGEVGHADLAEGCSHQQDHVQAAGWVLQCVQLLFLQGVDDCPDHGAHTHQGQKHNVVGIIDHKDLVAGDQAGGLDLVHHEDTGPDDYSTGAQQWPKNSPLEFEFGLGVWDVVVADASAHVLPHDVEHGAADQAVLGVEGVEQDVALLEDVADGHVWACAQGSVVAWSMRRGRLQLRGRWPRCHSCLWEFHVCLCLRNRDQQEIK